LPPAVIAAFIEKARGLLPGEQMGQRVARGTISTLLVSGAGAAASLVVQISLSNWLGPDAYGTYLLALGWLVFAQLFARLELDSTSVRFVGSYVSTGRWSLLRGYLRTSRVTVLTLSVVLAILGALAVLAFSESIAVKHPALPDALLVACLLLPVANLLQLDAAVLQGFQRYVEAQLPQNLLRPIAFGILLFVLHYVAHVTLTTPLAVGANIIAATLALILTLHWRKRAIPAEVRAAKPHHDRGTWARTAYPLMAVSLSQLVISQQADIVVVGTMLTTAQAAVYGAASQLTMPLFLAASAVAYVAQSMIANLYARDPSQLQSLIRAVTWISLAVVVPIAIGLIILGKPLLGLYGDGFSDGYTVLVILTFAQLTAGLVGALAGNLLTMTAHERQAAWIIGITAAVNLVLALILTPRFGPVGTASATLLVAVTRAVALRVYIRREMGLRIPAV